MIQTATINSNNNPLHPGIVMPSVLAALHPTNANHGNGKILSRSPSALQLQDQRSLSPNKLNATKKPMISHQNSNKNLNNNMAQMMGRNRNSTSPSPRANNESNAFQNNFNTAPLNNINNYPSQNFHPNNNINNNVNKIPLLNSNGYGRRTGQMPPPGSANYFDKTKYCMNHPNKEAQFVTKMQSQQFGYCQKCAINLASKGFGVTRKYGQDSFTQKQNSLQRQKFQPFHNPQFVGVHGYSQVQKFISNIDSIYADYLNQICKYQTIQQHYAHQIMITGQFYQSLMEIVQQMKQDHLLDLEAEAKKHSQLALIKQDNLKSDVQDMEVIRKDLIQSLEIILSDFENNVIQQTFRVYKQKIFTLKDKIQDQMTDFSKQIINQKESQLQSRLKTIEEFLLDIWNDKKAQNSNKGNTNNNQWKQQPKKQDKSPKAVKNIINLNEKNEQQNIKQRQVTACRRLFDDDDNDLGTDEKYNKQTFIYQNDRKNKVGQDLAGQTSPQFKNI